MAEGKSRSMWDHTSHLMTLIANIHRDPKKTKAFKVEDFTPYPPKRRSASKEKVNVKNLKDLFKGYRPK